MEFLRQWKSGLAAKQYESIEVPRGKADGMYQFYSCFRMFCPNVSRLTVRVFTQAPEKCRRRAALGALATTLVMGWLKLGDQVL